MRLWEDGAEFGDVIFWDVNPGGMITSVNTGRSGNYSYYFYSSSGVNTGYKFFGTNLSEFYFRTAIYGTEAFFGNIGWSYLGGHNIGMGWDVYNRPLLFSGDESAYTPLAYGINPRDALWNLYEFYIKIADVGGRAIVKQNGVVEIDYTGDTQPVATNLIDAFYVRCGTSAGLHLDDLALNDTTGGIDDSWCGDEHYELLPANDNGDVNNWDGSDGNKVNNFELVDDIPPDGDTTFVYSDTALQQDMYNVADFSAAGKIITRIYPECRARDSNATGGQIKIGFKTSGSVYLCTNPRTLSSIYQKVVGDDALVNPADSNIWEDADLDAIQFVTEDE